VICGAAEVESGMGERFGCSVYVYVNRKLRAWCRGLRART
jgi:hypothetical protein